MKDQGWAYLCQTCRKRFRKLKRKYTWVDSFGEPQADFVCPYCESDETLSISKCVVCGEWHRYRETINDIICLDCAEKLFADKEVMKEFVLSSNESRYAFAEWVERRFDVNTEETGSDPAEDESAERQV